MKKLSLYFSLIAIVLSFNSSAQTFASYSDISFLFKPDSTTRSVMISNMSEQRSGNQSPIMGAACWIDNGRSMECRSLLAFDYGLLPKLVQPERIISAYLFLDPVQLENEAAAKEPSSTTFTISRIIQPWQDSTTNWQNQPLFNTTDEVIEIMNARKKDHTMKIDVTAMVQNMFRFGNNGFLVSYKTAPEQGFLSQWFASAKNANEDIRPALLINYQVPARFKDPAAKTSTSYEQDVMERNRRAQTTVTPVRQGTETPPVRTPVNND